MKLAITILSLIYSCLAMAQSTGDNSASKANQYDENGKKHGVWWQAVACTDGEHNCHEWGYYDHGRKINQWIKMNGEGELLAKENYRNDALDGEVKYYDADHLTTIGHYRGLNPDNLYDTIVVVDPETGRERLQEIATDRGSLRHGSWKFYDEETGRLIKEEEYQVDELIYRKDYPVSKEDSTYYAQRNANLPHNKKTNYTPPPSRDFNYIDFK